MEIHKSPVHAEKEVIERSPNVTAVRRLTDLADGRWVGRFCLSSDGKDLTMEILDQETLEGNTKRTFSNLWCVDAAVGGGLRRITQGEYFDRHPTYSPDGEFLYFSSNRAGKHTIWRLSIKSLGGLGLVTSSDTSDGFPDISPDAQTLLYTAEMSASKIPQLWTTPIGRGLPMQVREGTGGRWSPDGTRILFSALDRGSGKVKVWVMSTDGSSLTQITHSTDCNDMDPCWSPDGTRIVFASDRGQVAGMQNFDIWIMKEDGSEPLQLTTNGSRDDMPIFTKDGRTVYFRSNRGLKWDVWVMRILSAEKESVNKASEPSVAPAPQV